MIYASKWKEKVTRMNLREGMRRVGMVLGLIGFCVGSFVAYDYITPLLRQATEAREYQAQLRVQGTESPKRGTGKYKADLSKYGTVTTAGPAHEGPARQQRDSAGDAAQKSSADLYPTFSKIPSFWQYLPALAFPLLGFLMPWGAIKALTWIGTGFVTSSAK